MTMRIDEAWLRKAWRALESMLDVDEHTRRAMIQFLFDNGFWDAEKLSWTGAEARWNSCINPLKAEFFKPGELWALAIAFNRPQLVLAMAEDLGFECRPIATEDRRQALLARLAAATEQHTAVIEELRSDLLRVEAADQAPGPRASAPFGRLKFSLTTSEEPQGDTPVSRVGCP